MSHQGFDQLASIQSMLVAGQRSVRIQRHSLHLWGVVGGVLCAETGHDLSLVLKHPVDIALRNGKPEGRYRIGAGEWASIRDGLLFLRIDQFSPLIENGKPVIRAHAVFNVRTLQKASREYE